MKFIRAIALSILGVVSLAVIFVITTTPAISSNFGFNDSNFRYAMKVVLQHEGGLTNDKADPGGITNYGISLRYIKDEHIDINHDGKVDPNDIIHLTQTEADQLYMQNWWKKYHYYLFKDKTIATKVMDASVNMGACRAHKLLKQALNEILPDKLAITCDLDDHIILLSNTILPLILHDTMKAQEKIFYRDIVKRNPHLHGFLAGWITRANW